MDVSELLMGLELICLTGHDSNLLVQEEKLINNRSNTLTRDIQESNRPCCHRYDVKWASDVRPL